MGTFSREVEDFVAAFKAGSEVGYKMRYLRYLEQQQRLQQRRLDFQERYRRRPDGLPADTQELIAPGRELLHQRVNENTTPQPSTQPPQKTATPEPLKPKTEAVNTEPTVKPAEKEKSSEGGASPSSGGGGSSGGAEKHASITDRYPGSYQTAALETGTLNDASPVRAAVSPAVSSPGGATPKAAKFDASKAPSYLDGIAQKNGIDPNDFKRMAWIESKFDPNAKAGSSSAGGLFQFTDDTAKRYGLSNKFDGVANAEAAARLWNDNKAGLTQALGRAPTAGELYLAHQQGLGGAKSLLTNPNASAASLVGRKAVVNNGGRADMSARDFADMWTSRFDSVGSSGTTAPARDAGSTSPASQARNTRQQTATDASSMSDANNDIRRAVPVGGTTASATTPKATTTPTTSAPAQYSPGANPEGKSFEQAYRESVEKAQPRATSAAPAAVPAPKQPDVAPPGTHYEQYGPNKILIDDKTGAPAANLKGWEHASEGAKAANGETPKQAVPSNEPPEFPNNKTNETPLPPTRPEQGPPMPEEMKPKPAVEPTQPQTTQPSEPAAQQDGWSFLDDIGQGIDDFFSDLNVSADWDVGAGGDWGSAGDAFSGIGDALGGIGDAIGGALGGLFERGGMVR